MTTERYLENLKVPNGKIDVVLDTDTYNEIDDQFAISYMLLSPEKFNVKGICAAPFHTNKDTALTGMEKSYNEILNLLTLAKREELKSCTYKGSTEYLADENTAVESDACDFMANLANEYSPENPLYIIAIGAITNVASAIIKNPKLKENAVVIWLGGHAYHIDHGANEYNMWQDIAAARVVFTSEIPLVQLPCFGVVDHLLTTKPELEFWLKGKNPLSDHLIDYTIATADGYAKGKPWSRVIWDVSAIAWALDENEKFMKCRIEQSPTPQYDCTYSFANPRKPISYVYEVNRDAIFEDLFKKLAKFE